MRVVALRMDHHLVAKRYVEYDLVGIQISDLDTKPLMIGAKLDALV